MSCLIIQFAKIPQAGKVKTRLQPFLGEAGCLQLHKNLVRHTACQIQSFVQQNIAQRRAALFVGHAPQVQDQVFLTANEFAAMTLQVQTGETLGARMAAAFEWGLQQADKVILVGSDCPVITPQHYAAVEQALDEHDFAFIPAEDGGYVLVAARKIYPMMFDGIAWGTDQVWAQTQQRIQGESVAVLTPLWDVDREADFNRLSQTIPELCVV